MATSGKWIGIDLDQTLAFYDEWRGVNHIGEPIPSVLEMVKGLLASGETVKIFTARATMGDQAILRVQEWLESVGLPRLEITAVKDGLMEVCYDDRAIQIVANTGELATVKAYEMGFSHGKLMGHKKEKKKL